MPKMNLKERIGMSIARSKPNVFLRKDFDKFGGYDQVGRALRAIMAKMGVDADVGSAARKYMAGKSTHLPVATVVNVGKARIARKIGFGGKQIRFER